MKNDEKSNKSQMNSSKNGTGKKTALAFSAANSKKDGSISDRIMDARDDVSDFFSRTFKKPHASHDANDASAQKLGVDKEYVDIVPSFAFSAEDAYEASIAEEAQQPSEYFDGELSPALVRRIFAPANPVKPEKLDIFSAPAASAAAFPEDDPEFNELQVPNSRSANVKEELSFKERFSRGVNMFWKIWRFVRIPIIIAATCFIIFFMMRKVGNKLYRNFIMPVDPNDASPVVVTIPTGRGASEIAKLLYEAGGEGQKGVIPHKAVFKVYVDFIGKSSRLQAGTYVLSRNMSIKEIVDTLCRGVPPKQVKKIQITEGMTIEVIADKLFQDGIISSKEHFLDLCKTGEKFLDSHPFISTIPADPTGERPYVLEGFLFPATYEVYFDANEETIIDKMLSRFEQIYGPIYTARTNELNMTMYDVIRLASTIEKEAKLKDDFGRVAAVFYNRLARNMNLASDATLEYVLKTGSLKLTETQLATPSGYNTHINYGLPIGPVSNPGDAAINAVLYPNQEYINDAYLYFCLMNPESGALAFARTVEEHNANIAKYSPLW